MISMNSYNMKLEDRINALSELGQRLKAKPTGLEEVLHRAAVENQWFTIENSQKAINAICHTMLDPKALNAWVNTYHPGNPVQPKRVGMVMAGNLPVVGFHDLLCVFVCGHHSLIKLSEKDKVILPYLLQLLEEIDPATAPYFECSERLAGFDAVIATGSNNSARYFETYFGKYPNIIRKNRNAVAILSGQESTEQMEALGEDIFAYFGLGCRSVSKLYVPEGYDFEPLLLSLRKYKDLVLHNKYKNNFDYNYTLYILNKIPHESNGTVLLVEDASLSSRIACLHYEHYEDEAQLTAELNRRAAEIQCVVSTQAIQDLKVIPPGKAQRPGLTDYADGVDTMQFLLSL